MKATVVPSSYPTVNALAVTVGAGRRYHLPSADLETKKVLKATM